MKNLCKAVLAVAIAAAAFSTQAQAQTVVLNGLGSSAMFLELGLAASSSTSGSINATCVWSESTNLVWASDTAAANLDKGSAWVAWTTGTGGSCSSPASDAKIYDYLQTDSVVGNRCLFDGTCKINLATTAAGSTPVGLILPAGTIIPGPPITYTTANCGGTGECALPSSVATALGVTPNGNFPNFAGSDIRPEDAEFATIRSTTPCGTAIGGTQYLGLGYANGGTINGWTPVPTIAGYSPSSFNVVSFSLPSYFTVTPIGATPVLVVANSNATAATGAITQFNSITFENLAKLLDGEYTTASQLGGTGTDSINVFIREPLSGTYNTMEYNIPNTTLTTYHTSQDVGLTQPAGLQNCPASTTGALPGTRFRAIGTGNELKATRLYADATGLINNLGYGFWSVANYAGYNGVTTAKYLKVDNVDPLLTIRSYTGVIPVTGSADLAKVDLHTVYQLNGNYRIWSMLRLVADNPSSTTTTAINSLAGAVQQFVTFGTSSSRPDFAPLADMKVVRSHFIPPTVSTTPNNGGSCGTEEGGDVGGVVLAKTDCTTGERY
jgi:ABC-type phosphate transport system substrate-binding protein